MKYAVIYSMDDNETCVVFDKKKSLKLFNTLEEADVYADRLENEKSRLETDVTARIIEWPEESELSCIDPTI